MIVIFVIRTEVLQVLSCLELKSFKMLNFLHLNNALEVSQLQSEYLFAAELRALTFLESLSSNAIGFHTDCIRGWRKSGRQFLIE